MSQIILHLFPRYQHHHSCFNRYLPLQKILPYLPTQTLRGSVLQPKTPMLNLCNTHKIFLTLERDSFHQGEFEERLHFLQFNCSFSRSLRRPTGKDTKWAVPIALLRAILECIKKVLKHYTSRNVCIKWFIFRIQRFVEFSDVPRRNFYSAPGSLRLRTNGHGDNYSHFWQSFQFIVSKDNLE